MADTPARKLAVIMHADVVGSTTLVRTNETLAHERIQNAFHRFSNIIDAYGGVAHEVRGDAIVAEFNRASDAVAASLAFQTENAQFNSTLDDEVQPHLRIGVAMGEVVIADDTVTGDGVVLAQRLEQLAESGGVCIQDAAYQTVPKRLPFEYENLGERKLKGFDDPVRFFAVSLQSGALIPTPERRIDTGGTKVAWLPVVAAAVTFLIVVGVGLGWWQLRHPAEPASTVQPHVPLPEKASIAVLPFTNLSGDPDQEYFSDGTTNDIITDLSKFRSLLVIASNTMFTYKGRSTNVQAVREELGVRYVLEGSVQKAGGVVRINAQLIDAITGHHLWADRYNRDLDDLFGLQDEIVQTVVTALAVEVDVAERKRVMRKPTDNLEAYDYALRGRELLARTTRPANDQARTMFRNAIDLDPRFASAYVGLGWTYRKSVGHGWTEFPHQALEQAHALAQKSLSFEESAGAHRLLGYVHLIRGQYDLASHALERAIELNSNDWDSQAQRGAVMLYLGQGTEAIEEYESALRFNPNMEVDRVFELGLAYYLEARYGDAIRTLEQSVGRHPDHVFLYIALAAAYAQAERLQDARRAATEVRRLHPFFEVASFGTRFRDSADVAQLADGLRKAGLD